MAAEYLKKYNRPAADKAWMGWMAAQGAVRLDRGRQDRPMPAGIVDALEHWSVKRGDITAGYRAFDHQMTNRLLVAGIKPKITDKWDYFDVKAELPATQADIDAAFGTQANSACKMDSL